MIRALVIDDERPARELIEALLDAFDDVVVVGECCDGKEALAMIKKLKPDLIFLDIRMPHLDGFGVLERLDLDSPPAVIFVTAYDQYAVRAFEVNALDYLLKPIRRQRFSDAIARVRMQLRKGGGESARNLRSLLQHWDRKSQDGVSLDQSKYLQRIFVKDKRKSVTIEVDRLDWLGSLDHFVELHSSRRRYILHEKLSCLEDKLDPSKFLRIHRTRIIKLSSISKFEVDESGVYYAHLCDDTIHRVARSRCKELQRLLSK